MTRGQHVSLMGVDGAGKTSVAEALVDALRGRGVDAEVVSWKRVMAKPGATADLLALQAMTSSKLQLFRASVAEETDAFQALLSESRPRAFRRAEEQLRHIPIERNDAFPFLSAALTELSGSVFIHHAYIGERLEAGWTVVEESCGFKHVLKNLLMARRLAPGLTESAERMLAVAQALFGALLRPSHGYWIDTDPRLALAWRVRGGEPTTNFEDYGLMGRALGGSFVAMQEDCRQAFAAAAQAWGWARIEMTDRPRTANVEAAVAHISKGLGR